MRISSEFIDERTKKVNHKGKRVSYDVTLSLDSGEALMALLPDATERKLLFIESGLVLDSETYSTVCLLQDEADATVRSLQLVPGEAFVLPIAATVKKVSITSNSSVEGDVRVALVSNA
tara:strand:- start:1161 stop:1517 length:357 start_codon:yes stop_codon:yes gene_type:complete